MNRLLDIGISLLALLVLYPFLLVIFFLGLADTGSPIFQQIRVGQNQRPFTLIKFRTMKRETLSVATHLADPQAVTQIGHFLRRSKLDELPQLWNVLKGEMSLVGPRPCLFSQEELIGERERLGVFAVRPGITGLAQIKGIDMSTPQLLAKTDAEMLASLGVREYFQYLWWTILGKGSGDRMKNKNYKT
jgi:O-antigen biosynthesis protein WbqP